jgi:hypothetical protein
VSRNAALAALVATCTIPLIWPGDVPFINDEPLLVINAVRANHAGHLAEQGLLGTFGFTYGPLPTWVYQALTAISHDLVVLATLHGAVMVFATAGAMWWISRSLRLWPWFACVPLLSPYFWFYSRVLWDNPFLIPLGALAIAGYAAYLAWESPRGLRLSVAAMIGILLVHLMGLALVVPLALHMLAIRSRALWRHRISIALIVSAGVAMAWPYWRLLAVHHAPGETGLSLDGLVFPFFGARLLSAQQLDYFFGARPVRGTTLTAATAMSSLAYILVWGGIAISGRRIIAASRTGDWTARSHIAAILIGALICQSIIDTMTGKVQHPQYYNGTWIVFTLLAWFAVDSLMEERTAFRWAGVATTGVLAASLLVAVASVAVRLHRSGGTREVYGPTIANQQRVARVLARYSPKSRVTAHVSLYELYPHTLAVLRELNPGVDDRPEQDLEVRYASGNVSSGAIEVVTR